jgi:hypothetical protein
MAATTRPTDRSRTPRARGLGAPRGGRARSAEGRRSSPVPSAPPTSAPANALLREKLEAWEANGGAASLVTITVPHDLDDPLAKLLDAERAAWQRVTQGAAWQRLKRRIGIAGHIIALEFTWGDQNGWHPHYHVLLVHDQDLDAAAIAQLHAHIHARLTASCRDYGVRQPGQLHAVRVDPNVSGTAAGAYVAKGGDWTPAEEMTRGDLKTSGSGSRTPFQIFADYYQTGDTRDRDLWHEYGRVARSLAAVRWSRGLRAIMLGSATEPERTDAQLAADDVNGDLSALIEVPVWSRIRTAGLEHALLVAAELGGPAAMNIVLRQTYPSCAYAIRQLISDMFPLVEALPVSELSSGASEPDETDLLSACASLGGS